MTTTFISDEERSIYERLELERVRRAVDLLSIQNAVISTIMNIVLLIFSQNGIIRFLPGRHDAFVTIIVATFVVIVGIGIGPLIVRLPSLKERTRTYLAAGFHSVFMQLMVSAIVIAYAFCVGIDAFVLVLLASMINVILLTGSFFQTTRSLILSLIGLNIVDVIVLLFMPIAPGFERFADERLLAIILALAMSQAAVAIFYYWSSSVVRNARRVADMQIAIERARQLDDLKNQFISSVNHELRNPIMAAVNIAGVLEAAHDRIPGDEQMRLLHSLQTSLRRLSTLVSSILSTRQMADTVARPTEPIAVLVAEAVKEAAKDISPAEGTFDERELRLAMPRNLAIWGDPIQLHQIFVNLLSNAIKYSPPGSSVEVTATLMEQSANPKTEIQIRDHGLGIPPAQIPLLFNRFVRLPRDIASPVIGNGLGLFLCRAYAEAMGGSIRVESTGIEGEGSAFILTLPAPAQVTAHS